MASSTVTVQNVVDFAKTFSELKPVLGVAGSSLEPALTIANDVMTAMLSPSMNWKFNRMNVTPFYTISWQQDYASTVTNLAWIEHAWICDINNTQIPKPVWTLEAVRDLERTAQSFGRPGQIAWLPNDQLVYGSWGASNVSSTVASAGNNPGALSVYTNPLGATTTPSNPTTQVLDTNGNLQALTTYGTTGNVTPSWPSASAAVGTTTNDGSCVWTVRDPKGQGFRLSPIPSQAGVVYQVNVVGQKRPPVIASLSTTIDPIPDDYAAYFRQGFVAHCYRHSPETEVRAKFQSEYALWIEAITKASAKADRERDGAGFYPNRSAMDQGGYGPIGPAWPYQPGWWY